MGNVPPLSFSPLISMNKVQSAAAEAAAVAAAMAQH